MLNRQRIAAVDFELELIDREIVDLHTDGFGLDVDQLLDRRLELGHRRRALEAGEVPNG